jgi:hypothetical protein
MLDTYDFKGDVWLCHSNGGKCNDFTAFVSELDVAISLVMTDRVSEPNVLSFCW